MKEVPVLIAGLFKRMADTEGQMNLEKLKVLIRTVSTNTDTGVKAVNFDQVMSKYDIDSSGKLNLDEFSGLYSEMFPAQHSRAKGSGFNATAVETKKERRLSF